MKIVKKELVPIYETECAECHSIIQYRKSEVSFCSYITRPVCGVSVWADTIQPVKYEKDE